jgi:hypothetical protein
MLKALQQLLDVDDLEFERFEQQLKDSQAVIFGPFALLFNARPQVNDWHPLTRKELLLLIWATKQLGISHPRNVLEVIGNHLSLIPLREALERRALNVGIITLDMPWPSLSGWARGYCKEVGTYISHHCKAQLTVFRTIDQATFDACLEAIEKENLLGGPGCTRLVGRADLEHMKEDLSENRNAIQGILADLEKLDQLRLIVVNRKEVMELIAQFTG